MVRTSLKARFALLAGAIGLAVVLATGGLFWGLHAAETAVERTLAAQRRLDLLAELSGRLAEYGLAAVDAVNASAAGPERLASARQEVARALQKVDAQLGDTVASAGSLLGRTEMAGRSRPLSRLRAALALLDGQLEQALRQPDAPARNDAVRGAFNAFAAVTGPSLSFLVDAERRAVESASGEARAVAYRLRMVALFAVAAALAGVGLLHRAMVRPLLKRIDAVRQAAGAIGRGELDTRLAVQERDELGLLAAGFNRMAARLARRERRLAQDRLALEETVARRTADLRAANERLEAVDRSRRRFFADVSHELRTPLTVILGECDVSLRAPPSEPAGYTSALATIRKRAQGLHRRVEDLLRLARSESGQIELDLKRIAVWPVLAEAVEACAADAKRRGIALKVQLGPSPTELLADRDWLRQVFEGLIGNALRHAAGATMIVVALQETEAGVMISVRDDGPGFPPDAERLFERFARAPDRSTGSGFGLGLPLARWVIEQHGGSIRIAAPEPARPGGCVVVELPLERKEVA